MNILVPHVLLSTLRPASALCAVPFFITIIALLLGISLVHAQDGTLQSAPMPPVRPFDMDMPTVRPNLVTPPRAPAEGVATGATAAPGAAGMQIAPAPPVRPASLPPRPAASTETTDDAPAQTLFPGLSFPGITTPSVPQVSQPSVPPPITPESERPQQASAEPPAGERQWPFRLPWQQQDPAESAPVDNTPTGPGITTDPGTSTACLPARLKTVLNKIVARYGSVRVTSTYRPAWRARRGSYHRRCEAMDFRVPGHRPGEVMAFVRNFEEVGGRKVYWNGLIHIDTGPVRSW
ncbi:MAG: D-Ala-D-Ala carboxypeptidase family metallohydrolase [Bosea sp. (in: a-proteobacteria)]